MAEVQQPQLFLAVSIAILKTEITTCITAEGESVQTRYRHDWGMAQQGLIRVSALTKRVRSVSQYQKKCIWTEEHKRVL